MEIFSTSRNSINFIQHITDDGSLDYSVDWETFSFEAELNTRNEILEEDFKAYDKFLNQPFFVNIGEDILTELRDNKEACDTFLKKHEEIFSQYKALKEDNKIVKENVTKLIKQNELLAKNSNALKEEETTSRNTYHQSKLALQKAYEMYTSYFNIDISITNLSETTYEASVSFKNRSNINPVKFIVDRTQRKVIEFRDNGELLPKEVTQGFGDSEKLPALLCALRDIVMKH